MSSDATPRPVAVAAPSAALPASLAPSLPPAPLTQRSASAARQSQAPPPIDIPSPSTETPSLAQAMASPVGPVPSARPAGCAPPGAAQLDAAEPPTTSGARAATPKDGSLQRALCAPHLAGNCAARPASVPASSLHKPGAGTGRRDTSDSAPSKKTPVQFRMQVRAPTG
tara:strand:- start:45 stop:551 length:507 start_codon:yes stop_codon:yes gene_type:complete